MFEEYKEVLTIKDVCSILRISRSAVSALIESGELKAFRPGKRQWRVLKTELEDFVLAGETKKTEKSKKQTKKKGK